MKTKAKQRRRWVKSLYAIVAVIAMFPFLHAHAWDEEDGEWFDGEYIGGATCNLCGETHVVVVESLDDFFDAASELFCDNCEGCTYDVNSECWYNHHCEMCGDCIDTGDYNEAVYEKTNVKICEDCWDSIADDMDFACPHCHGVFGEGVSACDCEWQFFERHCTDCSETKCSECGACLVVSGSETAFLDEGGCSDHELCWPCLRDKKAGQDGEHCRECYLCDSDICDECALCEQCAEGEEHCPECQTCFGGNDIDWCKNDGYHCVECCDDNNWLCENCGRCTEGAGLNLCNDCGLCEECCREKSESEGCDHGYCIDSSDYEEHLCPECQQCATDEKCDDCGRCESCQADYHCEHELCPEGSEWDDHLCPSCGNCFEEDEFCEYCGLCESCRDHCDHDFCPENDNEDDHFICEQCDNCHEGNPCEYCGLCEDCCHENTAEKDCDHDFCVASDDFAEHWCYEDEQCLEYCNHDANCEHLNVSTAWSRNGNAHWHACEDCGKTFDKAIHTEGTPITLTAPDADNRKNGTAQVNCAVCNHKMSIISIPYVVAPADGKPYIISQPTDYTGKTNTSAYITGGERWATFKVKAGGEGLTYQWYRKYGDRFITIDEEPRYFEGTKTATLKAYVYGDACDGSETYKYYCVVTNANGSVQSNTVAVKAQHVWGNYFQKDAETHENCCFGECSAVKNVSKHRLDAWELVRPATSTETGLRQQKCMDCNYKNEEVIPKVEANHVHNYNVWKYNLEQHWLVCSCGIESPNPKGNHNFRVQVITPATPKATGEEKHFCATCSFSKKVKTDKVAHDDCDWEIDHARTTKDNHYWVCTGCEKKSMEAHNWGPTTCTEAPRDKYVAGVLIKGSGKMTTVCNYCGYKKEQTFLQNSRIWQWPVLTRGPVMADVSFGRPGQTTVTVTYDEAAAKKTFGPNTRFLGWYSAPATIDPQNDIAWPSESDPNARMALKNVMFDKHNSETKNTFTMPDGPVLIVAHIGQCDHRSSIPTYQGKKLWPTCTNEGHEPHTLCGACNAVLTEGNTIPALGHRLDITLSGTEKTPYCMLSDGTINTEMGKERDYVCTREGCEKKVKGEKLPRVHGKDGASLSDDEIYEIRNEVKATCTKGGYSGDKYCKLCDTRVERGSKTPSLGHKWSDDDWTVVQEATPKIKGKEQRSCQNGCGKVETRVTDYSGPDYTLKADKTTLKFEWVYGDTPAPQTVSFTSTGRDKVNALAKVDAPTIGGVVTLDTDGLNLTVTPDVEGVQNKVSAGDEEDVVVYSVVTDKGETNKFTAPLITVGFNIKKTSEKFTLTVEDGLAVHGTNRRNTLQVRGGEKIQLEPEDEWKQDFLRWEIVNDASGMAGMSRIEDAGNVSSAAANKGLVDAIMSPNDVTVRAVYKQHAPTLAFSETAISVNVDMPFTEPKLRITPGSLTVIYSSSDESVAKVDPAMGKLTILTGGTVTITATSEANAHYESGTATYTLTAIPGVPITEENFPDEHFRDYLLAQDYGTDGFLADAEIEEITKLDIRLMEIADLTGIGHFTALEELSCGYNQLAEIDLSQNTALQMLSCSGNPLKTLDLAQNTALKYLYCYDSQLTELDLTQNRDLEYLYCWNNQLKSLDLSQNTAMTQLLCYENGLPSLDLSALKLLEEVKLSPQKVSVEAVALADGRVGIALPGVTAPEQLCSLLADGSPMAVEFVAEYLVIAASSTSCPSEVTYDFNVQNEAGGQMQVVVSVDSSTLFVSGVRSVGDSSSNGEDAWYTIDGKKLNGEPKKAGIYIHNGKKVVK